MCAMPRSVLVLGCDERSGLTVIRSLGRAGIAVDVGWLTRRFASKSRYVRNVFDLPDPNDGSGNWLDALKDLLINYKYDLVLPCDDRAIIPVQQNKTELSKYSCLYALADDAFLATFNKYQTTLVARQCGIQLPRWVLINSPEEISTAGAGLTFPVVLKPISSFDLEQAVERREVRTIGHLDDLEPALKKMLDDGPVQVQAFFRGKGVGVELLAKDGQVLVAFQHERVHEPLTGGGSSYRRSVPLDPRLLSAAKALVTSLRYTGVLMAEFRVNPETNDWILIETNGRFWGSLPLAVVSGVDFPLYLYQMLTNGRTEFPTDYKIGVYSRNLWLDLQWFKKNLKADRSDRTLQVVPLSHIWVELRTVLTFSDHIDTFAIDDPEPFFAELGALAGLAIGTASTRVARLIGISRLLKNLRAMRAFDKVRAAKKITFVCYGNICRSPFAEAYARLIASKGIAFSSAGTFNRANRRSPSAAQAVAKQIGVELGGHRSKILSASVIAESDVIVVFDHQNWKEVLRRYPQSKPHIVRLADFLPGTDDEIADPYGQTVERYEQCFQTIAHLLSRLFSTGATNAPGEGAIT
jgi:protein-tyrosine-phosphatase/predicted ATP-grasp superfamily ATP-dependent carboligase